MKITPAKLERQLMNVLRAGRMPYITGSPGTAKSSIVKQVANKYNLKLLDIRLAQADVTDLNGLPFMNSETGKATFFPFDMWPLENTPLPEGYSGWLILLDELSSCRPSVQAAAYKVILDRMVGMDKLHPKVALIGAGNKMSDKAVVVKMSSALESRMVHFELEMSTPEWLEWANDNDIDFRICAYIGFRPENLHKFDPNHNDMTHANTRTWEILSDIIKPMSVLEHEDLPTFCGTVSEGIGREFFEHTFIYQDIPSIPEIVANPKTAKLGEERSMYFALSSFLASHMNKSNVEPFMVYLQRLPVEFQIIAMRATVKRFKGASGTVPVSKWMEKIGNDFF